MNKRQRKAVARTMTVESAVKRFEGLRTLEEVVTLIREAGAVHRAYYHYTTIEALLKILETKTWWLTRSDSMTLDDLIEARKYGERERRRNLYFGSFTYQHSESAAMWRLYSDCSERAVRIEVSGKAVRNWIADLNSGKYKIYPVPERESAMPIPNFKASVHDVLYASVEEEGDVKRRAKSLCWNDHFTKALKNLVAEKKLDIAAGILKDYEWRFEYESRFAVESEANLDCEKVAVEIPDEVIRSMKVVRSPWIRPDRQILDVFRKTLGGPLSNEYIVSESVLTGALEKWARR